MDVVVDASRCNLSVTFLSCSVCHHPKVLVTIITSNYIRVNILARRLEGNTKVYAEGTVPMSKGGFCQSMRLLSVAAHYELARQDRFNLKVGKTFCPRKLSSMFAF